MHLVLESKLEDLAGYAGHVDMLDSGDITEQWIEGLSRKVSLGHHIEKFPELRFKVTRKPPDMMYFGVHFIISDRIKDIMESFSAEAVCYPVQMQQGSRILKRRQYFLLSFLKQNVECVDIEQSEGRYFDRLKKEYFPCKIDREIDEFTKLVLNEEILQGIHLCKSASLSLMPILRLISKELACSLEAERLTGMWFYSREQYPLANKIRRGIFAQQPLECDG